MKLLLMPRLLFVVLVFRLYKKAESEVVRARKRVFHHFSGGAKREREGNIRK
jgi:hypothetical protein